MYGAGDLEVCLLSGLGQPKGPKRGPSSVRSGFSSDDTNRGPSTDRRGSGTVRELQRGREASRLHTGKVPDSRQQSSYSLPGAAAPQIGALPTAMRTDGTPLCTKKCGIATAVLAVVGAGLGAGLSYLFREDIQKFWKEKEYVQVLTGAAVGAVVLAGAFLLGRAVWRRLECGGGSKLVKRPAMRPNLSMPNLGDAGGPGSVDGFSLPKVDRRRGGRQSSLATVTREFSVRTPPARGLSGTGSVNER